jgi:NAD(P)-dependent dehydrogenase (short-subunit alcohol dehydrogenase family)
VESRGNAAYNASKAAVKSLTESLAYELRSRPQANVTAHLFMYVSVVLPCGKMSCNIYKPRMDVDGVDGGRGGPRRDRGKTGGGMDGTRDGAVHAGPSAIGRLLYSSARQRDATGGGPVTDLVGSGRYS